MGNNRIKKIGALVLTGLMLGLQPAGAEDGFRVGTGVNYSSGSSSGTHLWSMQLMGSYEKGPLLFKLTVPYLRTTGSNNNNQADLGDVVVGVTCNVLEGRKSRPRIDITGKMKIGTGNNEGDLGSSKNDYSLQADVAKANGKFTALGMGGYRWNGDSAATNYKNVTFGSVGGSYKFTGTTSGGLLYNAREASREGFSAEQSLTTFVSHKFHKNRRLQVYMLNGLSDSAADIGFGASVSTGF